MNGRDDPFEEALRQGLAARTDELEIPEDLGRGGIRRARRRTARRTAMVGVPAAVAAALVVVVVGLAGGGGRASHTPGQSPSVTPPATINVSDVVRRVSARVKALNAANSVIEIVSTTNKQRGTVSSLSFYNNPRTGVAYQLGRYKNLKGAVDYIYWNTETPIGHGRAKTFTLDISPLQKVWTASHSQVRVHGYPPPAIEDTARKIATALKKSRIRLDGHATVQGQKALRLKLTNTIPGGTTQLYVDAVTYQPLEEVYVYRYPHRHHLVYTDHEFLKPATPSNVAQLTDRPSTKGDKRG